MREGLVYAASIRSVLSLADCIFVAVESPSDSGEIKIAQCLGTFYGPDPFLSRLKCLAYWQSRQPPPDSAVQIVRYASRRTLAVVPYLRWTEMSHRGATICVLSVRRRFSPFQRRRLMQPTVIHPRSSVLIGRPIGLRNLCAGLCKVFGRGAEGCSGMVDAWELYECWLICDTNAASHEVSYLEFGVVAVWTSTLLLMVDVLIAIL